MGHLFRINGCHPSEPFLTVAVFFQEDQEKAKCSKKDEDNTPSKTINLKSLTTFTPEIIYLIYRISETMLGPSVIMYIYHMMCIQDYHDTFLCNNLEVRYLYGK